MSFDIILADPPWRFRYWGKDQGKKKGSRGAERHYNVMGLNDICDLEVGKLCGKNAALFLWSVWPRIFDAKKVIEAWGFTYRTIGFVWVKTNKRSGGLFWGLGKYTRSNTEPCLLAVKGRMPVDSHSVHSVIYSPVRKHSQKPDEIFERIEALYPKANYLELFARERRPGWAVWGNEVESDVWLG